jgi:hypothetical protein
MDELGLFTVALGLNGPWRVTRTEFDVEAAQLDLYLVFGRGARFGFPAKDCAHGGCPVHDTVDKTWRHLNFFQYRALLHTRLPRVRCPERFSKYSFSWSRNETGRPGSRSSPIVTQSAPGSHRDINPVIGTLTDQRVNQCGSTFSRAKYAAARLRIITSSPSRRLSRLSCASSFLSPLVSRASLPRSSASAWATQLRKHDSEIRKSFANSTIGLTRSRANSTARRRTSAGRGGGPAASFPVAEATSGRVSVLRGKLISEKTGPHQPPTHPRRPPPITYQLATN